MNAVVPSPDIMLGVLANYFERGISPEFLSFTIHRSFQNIVFLLLYT